MELLDTPSPQILTPAPAPPGHGGAALYRHDLGRRRRWRGCAIRPAKGFPPTLSDRGRGRPASSLLVPETRRAWQSGVSFWKGERNINAVSIGIELVKPGHEWGYTPYPKAQIDSLLALLDDIRGRWTISDDHIIVGHSDGRARPQAGIRASCFPGSNWPKPATVCGSSRRPRPARLWPRATMEPACSRSRPA